jgi:hypothetical protein
VRGVLGSLFGGRSAEADVALAPAAGKSTAIITRAGYERLREEFNELWKVRRPRW